MTRKFHFGIIILSLFCCELNAQQSPPTAYSSGTYVNFVRSWDARYPEPNASTLVTKSYRDVMLTTKYLDGLARAVQIVVKEASQASGTYITADMVSPIVYDDQGREQYKYGAFSAGSTGGNISITDGGFKLNPFQQQAVFMQEMYSGQGETYFYSKSLFESSPLSRTTKVMPAGNSWVGSSRGVETKYWFNTTTDDVKKWWVADVPGDWAGYWLPPTDNYYLAGELYKSVRVDEHGKQIIEFTDRFDKLILKKVQLTASADNGTGCGYIGWICTYYLYDDFGNLRCLVQPKGVELLVSTNWEFTSNILDEQCFRYEYDSRNRMFRKKIPGASEVWIIYDSRDRVVLTQDGNLRFQQKWSYNLYDEMNRPLSSGLLDDPVNYNNPGFHITAAYNSTSYPNLGGYNYEELCKSFYDDYSWSIPSGLSSSYNINYDNYLQNPSNNSWPFVQPNIASVRVTGLATGSKIKVLGTSTFLYTVSFYDEKSRPIQVQSTNYTGGVDVITNQYNWFGLPIITIQKHQKSGVNSQTAIVVTQKVYDLLGRVSKIEKKISHSLVNGGAMSAWKVVSSNEYDKAGVLKKKILAPAYNNNTGLESQVFEYNIRGWLLGVNRNYARDLGNDNYFGFDLGYDKSNNGAQWYNYPQFNGNIEGMIWKVKSDGYLRKYDFTYDASNRIMRGDYSSANPSTLELFDVKMGDGSSVNTAYDMNGNILQMQQWGLKLSGGTQIDNLSYFYQSNSNKLTKVTDINNDPNTKLGDFHDGSNGSSDDYSYDLNGNLNIDQNKAISSISYNHLNLPLVITVTGKGTITYTYDASGNKLRKTTVDNTVNPTKTTVTDYMAGTVYENDMLQHVAHEEGRVRFKPEAGQIPASLQYDYMLKDHLGNVRAVITEETQTDAYPPASMETAQASIENTYYSNIENTRTQKPYNYPYDPYTNPNDYASKVIGSGNKIGPTITLKVMAGDKFNIRVSSWYYTYGVQPGTPISPLNDLITAITNGIGNIAGSHGGPTSGELTNSGIVPGQITNFLNSRVYTNTKPRAFLNWILFDEQFKFVSAGSGFDQVGLDNDFKIHQFENLPITKSGWLYVYVSNETPNIDVYFDNLQVTHIRGPLTEVNHYYPFGLIMEGITSRTIAFGQPANKELYNGQELQRDLDLNWYQYKWRNMDPQVGRFFSIDPLSEKFTQLTPYQFSSNNPISMRELEGLEGIKFQEVTESGALQRWVIQVDVYVVEVKKANKKSMSKKERRERVESSYHKGDAAMVKKELDLFFNDVKGEGQKNSKGETVYFDFNVKEIVIDGNDKITERELRNKGARKFSTESGELHYVDQETGKNVYLKSPANILLAAVGDDVNTRGHNDQIVTKLNYSERFSGPTLLHEMLHQLITQPGEKEHALGGGLESPAGSINTKNVDQALNDAYLSKDPKRVVTTKK